MNTFIQSVNHFQCVIRITAFCFKVGCQSFKRIQCSQRIWHWFVTFRNFRTYAFSIIIFVKIMIIWFYSTCDVRVSQFSITLCTVVEADKFVKICLVEKLGSFSSSISSTSACDSMTKPAFFKTILYCWRFDHEKCSFHHVHGLQNSYLLGHFGQRHWRYSIDRCDLHSNKFPTIIRFEWTNDALIQRLNKTAGVWWHERKFDIWQICTRQ